MTPRPRTGLSAPPGNGSRPMATWRRLLSLLTLLLMSASCLMAQEDQRLYYEKWHYSAVVHENNTIDVTETVTVHYNVQMHGIWRYIPTKFFMDQKDDNGADKRFWYQNECKVTYVSADHELESADDTYSSIILKIGNADRYVSGTREYTYSYTLAFPNDRVQTHDFFYMSIMGADQECHTENFTFDIRFDKALPADAEARLQCFSGAWGQSGNTLNLTANVDDYSISGSVPYIPDHCAATIKLILPEGYFIQKPLPSNIPTYMLVGTGLLMLLWVLFRELTIGADKVTSVVTFYPPKDISSAEVGTIIDDSVDIIDLTSLVPYLAGKGYINIEEIPDSKGRVGKHADLKLTKVKDLPEDAPDYQKKFMQVFFVDEKECLVSELGDRHSMIERTKSALEESFTGSRKLTDWDNAFGVLFGSLMLTTLGFACSSVVTGFNMSEVFMWGTVWFLPLICMAFYRMENANFKHIDTWWKRFYHLGVSFLVGCIAFACSTLMTDDDDLCISIDHVAMITIAYAVACYFCGRLNRDTAYRKEKMGELLGLREFIKTAEADRIKMLVDDNPQYFYDILPYAMVFELSDKWAKQFASLDISKPEWYSSTSNTVFSGNMLASNLTSTFTQSLAQVVESSSHDPSSASSGGGGFSGGGGGGGGGGGW